MTEKSGPEDRLNSKDLLVAMNHPLRREILRRIDKKDLFTPGEIAKELHRDLSIVSYHVRVLAECRAIVLVGEKPVRGATQHFYRPISHEPWVRDVLDLDPD